MAKTVSLTQTLEMIKKETEGSKITFGEMADILNSRGFGPLLIAPALIVILPTGAIPTVPTICAAFIIMISVQILMGWKHPWFPKRLEKVSFDRATYKARAKQIEPYLKWIDQFFKPRLTYLTGHVSKKIAAILCILLAFCMSIVELVPFLAALPALSILMLGLGLSMRDGILMLLGYSLIFMVTIFVIPFTWNMFI